MQPHSSNDITPTILAIAGGSGSGKTTLASRVRDAIGAENCHIVRQDDYYHDIRKRGGSPLVNFDVPEALDFELLEANLLSFKNGIPVSLPTYDFTTHQRGTPGDLCQPRPVIIVEGILLLNQSELREIFDHSVFLRCAPGLRLSRRMERDTTERGRTPEDVHRQFHEQVEPAHKEFVSPSKHHADVVIEQLDYIRDTGRVVSMIINDLKLKL